MGNLFLLSVFVGVVLLIADSIFLSETKEVNGFLKSTDFQYQSDKTLTTEEAFKIANSWNVNVTVDEGGAEKIYSCTVSKDSYINTEKLINQLSKTGPLPANVWLREGMIFPGKTCVGLSYVAPTDYLEKVSSFAKIKSFHYYGESEEQASGYEILVNLTLLKEMRRIEIACPIDKQGYTDFEVGKTLLAKVYKNTLGKGNEAYYCEAVYEMKDK